MCGMASFPERLDLEYGSTPCTWYNGTFLIPWQRRIVNQIENLQGITVVLPGPTVAPCICSRQPLPDAEVQSVCILTEPLLASFCTILLANS